MPKNVEIRVYRIAQTQINEHSTDQWLKSLGADTFAEKLSEELQDRDMADDQMPDGDYVVGLAGKRCYMSFEVGLNPNVTKIREDWVEYLTNILSSGHGCYDQETDVLTSTGWKNWTEVSQTDFLATMTKSGKLVYCQPNKIISYDYRGQMYRVDSQSVDLLVTPNHNMFICPMTRKPDRKKPFESYRLSKASDVGHRPHAYLKHVPGVDLTIPDANIAAYKLLGFAIGDASKRSTYAYQFHLRRQRKIAYLFANAAEAGWKLESDEENDKYTVFVPEEFAQIFSQIYNENKEKVIPQSILETGSTAHLLAIFDGLMNSDGSQSDSGDLYDTTSLLLAGQVQQLCLHLGWAANISQAECYKDRKNSYGKKPMNRLYILTNTLRPEVNRYAGQKGKTFWVEDWAGPVYCAEMPDIDPISSEPCSHTLYVRRNGKPVWCGNSVLEHSTYTYAIEGVTRVFTAECNRHRAGVAISEGSLRFIRFEEIPFWMPLTLRPAEGDDADLLDRKSKSRDLFVKAFQEMEGNYKEFTRIWDIGATEKNFHYKKIATSCARRMVGMGVSTGGIWTGNIRSLRHILAMRSTPQAEEEIAHVFSLIGKDLVEGLNSPLFKDFQRDPQGFWVPKYPKV